MIKHAGASQVSVHISFAEKLLRVSIEDNGCGFDIAETRMGHGLMNMKQRLADIGGSCSIQSCPGKGTTVEFWLPVSLADAAPEGRETADPVVTLKGS